MRKTKRALIADDHSLYRDGLVHLLKDQLGYREILEAANLERAVKLFDVKPDIELALFDLAMPGMIGPGSLTPLRLSHPSVKIAIVAASEAKSDVLAAIAAGLSGFIPKSLPTREFIAALQIVEAGGIYVPQLMKLLDPALSGSQRGPLPGNNSGSGTTVKPTQSLTPRQQEVLVFIRAGMTNRQIAERLQVSIGTVKFHVAALLSTLNVKNRVELAASVF